MREFGDDELVDAAPGTPPGRRAKRPSVWCAHGVEWQWVPHKALYVATDALTNEIPGHETGAVEVGSITCQPTYGYPPRQHIQGEQ